MSTKTLNLILNLLSSKNICFKHIQHGTIPKESIYASKIRGTKHEKGAKALILQTKSKNIIQVILPANKRISLKKLKQIIHEKNISLAHPDKVLTLSDCVIGSVPPFGILWNIQVFIDNSLLKFKEVVFSAGTLNDSIFIEPEKLVEINNAILVDISVDE